MGRHYLAMGVLFPCTAGRGPPGNSTAQATPLYKVVTTVPRRTCAPPMLMDSSSQRHAVVDRPGYHTSFVTSSPTLRITTQFHTRYPSQRQKLGYIRTLRTPNPWANTSQSAVPKHPGCNACHGPRPAQNLRHSRVVSLGAPAALAVRPLRAAAPVAAGLSFVAVPAQVAVLAAATGLAAVGIVTVVRPAPGLVVLATGT